MNTKKKLMVLIPVGLVLCYIVFKCWALFYYRTSSYLYNGGYDSIKFDEKTIRTDKSLANTKFKNLNFYLPDGMVQKVYEQEYNYNVTYINKEDVNNEKQLKRLSIFSGDYTCEDFSNNSDAKIKDGKSIMEKNNFKNEYDVLRYFYNNFGKKNNLFTPLSEIKFNYFVHLCSSNAIISIDKNYFYLNGDVTGLYGVFDGHSEFRNEYSIDVYDEKNKRYYYISFAEEKDPYDEYPSDSRYKEIFTEDMMEKILSSIYFD